MVQDPLIGLLTLETISMLVYRRLQNGEYLSAGTRAIFETLAREKHLRAKRLLLLASLDELRKIVTRELPSCDDQLLHDTAAIVDALNQRGIDDLKSLSLAKKLELAHWNYYLNSALAYDSGERKKLICKLTIETKALILLLGGYFLEKV